MKNELDILEDVSTALISNNIPFMVTGSMAMNYYSIPRMTRDIDFVIQLNINDVDRIVEIFKSEFYIDKDMVIEAISNHSMFNIIHNDSIIKVDIIIQKNQEFRKLEFQRKKRVTINNFETFLVSREDLILSKLIWAKDSHSELQLRDIRNLLDGKLDKEYLLKWSEKLEVKSLLESCYE